MFLSSKTILSPYYMILKFGAESVLLYDPQKSCRFVPRFLYLIVLLYELLKYVQYFAIQSYPRFMCCCTNLSCRNLCQDFPFSNFVQNMSSLSFSLFLVQNHFKPSLLFFFLSRKFLFEKWIMRWVFLALVPFCSWKLPLQSNG